MKNKTNKLIESLGELEAEIMEIVWELNEASVRQVLVKLRKKRKIAYTTVMTVMTRLCDKEVLRRTLNDKGAYIYTPAETKGEFFATASKKAINRLINEFGEVAIAQFVDIIETSDLKDVEEWRKKLKM